MRQQVLAAIKGGPVDHRPRPRQLEFRAVSEARPGPKLRSLYRRAEAAYRNWYLRDGEAARPSPAQARAALARHMPELVAPWERLVEAVGADEFGARMLTLYDPPPLVSGCSQAVLPGGSALVRNYDYDPHLFDAVVLHTRLASTRVLGTADQLWGLLDGVNDRGLAVSFTFGGRRATRRGFSVPLMVRYLLETCGTVGEAVAALDGIPVQAAYNLTLVDRGGRHATVFVGPDGPPRVGDERAATNHQGTVDWPEHARWTRSVERLGRLEDLLAREPEQLIDAMLAPPLRSRDYEAGFGTLYTAVLRPGPGTIEYRWPGATRRQSLDAFSEQRWEVDLTK